MAQKIPRRAKGRAHAAATTWARTGSGAEPEGASGSPRPPDGASGGFACGSRLGTVIEGTAGPAPGCAAAAAAAASTTTDAPGAVITLYVPLLGSKYGKSSGGRLYEPACVGRRTTSSVSVPSKSFPCGCVRLGLGCTVWKSEETSRAGSPRISGQFPVPESSTVHVMGSPVATRVGTTLDAILNSPTAPVNPAGAGGRGRTLISAEFPATENCWDRRCWKNPKPLTPTLRLTSWLGGVREIRPEVRAIARVWYARPFRGPPELESYGSGCDQSSATSGLASHSNGLRPQFG